MIERNRSLHTHAVPRWLKAVVCTVLLGLSMSAVADSHPDIAAGDWQTLFDGTSLEHWRTYGEAQARAQWQIRDGVLVLNGSGGGDLISRQSWQNFELLLDWKISDAGNSGVFILADESDYPIYVHAPEVQILDDARASDNKLANHRSGSLYDLVAAPVEAQKPAGEWNRLYISYNQGLLTVEQNDVQVVEIVVGSPCWEALVQDSKFADWPGFGENTAGHIGLQDHGDTVWFRNIRVRAARSTRSTR